MKTSVRVVKNWDKLHRHLVNGWISWNVEAIFVQDRRIPQNRRPPYSVISRSWMKRVDIGGDWAYLCPLVQLLCEFLQFYIWSAIASFKSKSTSLSDRAFAEVFRAAVRNLTVRFWPAFKDRCDRSFPSNFCSSIRLIWNLTVRFWPALRTDAIAHPFHKNFSIRRKLYKRLVKGLSTLLHLVVGSLFPWVLLSLADTTGWGVLLAKLIPPGTPPPLWAAHEEDILVQRKSPKSL